jgi:hypothetical protein
VTIGGGWAARCKEDGEFHLASRYWTGSLEVDLGDEVVTLVLLDGEVVGAPPPASSQSSDHGAGRVVVTAPAEVWEQLLSPYPPPLFNDIVAAQASGLRIRRDTETFWQYYPAVRRAIDLLRDARAEASA